MTRDPRFLGMALTLLRERCGKGKGQVAREAEVQRGHLLSYERGETVPRPETLARLAPVLGTTVERIEAMADSLAAAPGLLGPSDLQAVLLPDFARRAEPTGTPETLWLRLQPYTPAQRRAIVLECPELHSRELSERLRQEARLGGAAARDLGELAALVESLAPLPR